MSPKTRASQLVLQYRQFLDQGNTLRFVTAIENHYTMSTLGAILRRGDCETRRASALALSMLGDWRVIELLGGYLQDADRGVRLMVDDAFRAILMRSASTTHQQQLLRLMHLNDGAEFAAALSPAMVLIGQAPHYAEAHHQLAVAYHGLGEIQCAHQAYRSCLWHCRFHYMAWAGLGECSLCLGEKGKALRYFDRATEICPDFESARLAARSIRRSMQRRRNP